jgi:hypothetical protein
VLGGPHQVADIPETEDIGFDEQLGLAALVIALFILAVQREFPGGASRGEVIRFVGKLRAALPADESLDTRSAEEMITRVLELKRNREVPDEVGVTGQLTVIEHLLDPAKIGPEELEKILAKAVDLTQEQGLEIQLAVERAHGNLP